jgi:uncharacterized protein (DUF58 family)
VRIPKTSFRTAWRADWLIEFGVVLVALAILMREIVFVAISAAIPLVLAGLGLVFYWRLGMLRRELRVEMHLSKNRVLLGDVIEGELAILNESQLAAHIPAIKLIMEKSLSFKLSPSLSPLLQPGASSRLKFTIIPAESGSFKISGSTLTLIDGRGLFASEVNYPQADSVDVHPGVGTKVPLTPFHLYGESPEALRKTTTGVEYAGAREYVPGDEAQRVEWKATARHRKLMVKEFHPETQTVMQILINTGRTMHQQSYVGSRFDEAIAAAQLLVGSGNRVGILVYSENEIVRTIKPENIEEQLASLQELALRGHAQSTSGEPASRAPAHRALWRETSDPFDGGRLGVFFRLLKLKLGSSHRKAGAYKAGIEAIRASPDGLLIVLTDLEADNEALLELASTRQKRGKTVVAQIGSAWRLSDSLEEAYVKYQTNRRLSGLLERFGITVFDVRPEELIDRIAHDVGKGSIEAH